MLTPMRTAPKVFLADRDVLCHLSQFTKDSRVLVVSGRTAWDKAGVRVKAELEKEGAKYEVRYVGRECHRRLIAQIAQEARDFKADWVLGVGGGKVMDLCKLAAEAAGSQVALIPTTPATCACWTSLSVVYDEEGKYTAVQELANNPDLCLADYSLLATAPPRHLAAGALDAIAKWYEVSSIVDDRGRANPSIKTALAVAEVCRNLTFAYGPEAVEDLKNGRLTDAVEKMFWVNLVSPGISSGLVIEKCKFGIPHAFYNYMSGVEKARLASLHGEQVAYGIAVTMLVMKPPHPELLDYLDLCERLDVPLSITNLGIEPQDDSLKQVIDAVAKDQGIDILPFEVTESDLWNAVDTLERLAAERAKR